MLASRTRRLKVRQSKVRKTKVVGKMAVRYNVQGKKKCMCFILACSIVFFSVTVSCSSLKQPKEIFTPPDYTEDDVKNNEIKRIADLKEDYPVQALWRAHILGDEEVILEYKEHLVSLLNESLEKNEYASALKYFYSLKTFSPNEKFPDVENKIRNGFYADVPGLYLDEENTRLLPKTMADCVDATVTIWVDRGIKIEHGAGYADRSIGSGFFIDKRGYIVTNHHVISDLVDPKREGYTRLFIKLNRDSETRIPAKVIGYDAVIDLALLKTEIEPPFILSLGSSSDLQIGEKVSCIGTPLGLHGTVTTGIVSNVNRQLFTTGTVLQIDAAINPGNSGGPCIDGQLRVQAIGFAGMLQYQGLNFAIPVEYLRQDLPYLYSGGKRSHAWIGAYGHTMREGLSEMGLEIQYVMPGGVASRSGLVKGDVITFVNGRKVRNLEDMQNIMRSFVPENLLMLNYVRDGESKECLVYLDERPEYPGYEMYRHDLLNNSFVPIFGMALANASTVFSRKYIITEIIKGSIADESGFSVTDPVSILEVKFNEEKSVISVGLSTRRKKKGYLDITMGIGAQLDSPYYF